MQAFFYLFMILFAIALAVTILSFLAPVVLFALKAGLLRVPREIRDGPWKPEKAWGWAALFAGGMTLLGFFGAFFLALTTIRGWPDVERAYGAAYGALGCRYPPIRGTWSDACLFGSVGNVIKADALPFFIATTILLYSRAAAAHARQHTKSVWPFLIPALVGAGVFFISTHLAQWFAALSSHGTYALIDRIISAALHEITAPFTLLRAFASNNSDIAIANWFRDEFVRIGGSFYKMASLYPKALFVLLLGGLIAFASTPQYEHTN